MAQARRAQMLVDGSNACMSILQDRLRCIDPTVTLTLRLVLNSSCEALSLALEACEKYFFTSGQAPNAKKFDILFCFRHCGKFAILTASTFVTG